MTSRIVVLDPADNATLHQAALVTAELLRGIGARVDVQAMDWSTLTQRRTSRKPPEEGGWSLFVTGATISSISNPLTNNFARNCANDVSGAYDPRIPELVLRLDSGNRYRCAPQDHRSAAASSMLLRM